MPNHVTNQIEFDPKHTDAVRELCDQDGTLDFEKLIPSPPHMYSGNLSFEDEADFPCNWNDWNRANWGTKWDAYSGSLEPGVLRFDTAWSVPYPIIVALANKLQIPFTHKYFDEGHNFWGVETWGVPGEKFRGDRCIRLSKRRDDPDDEIPLCIELTGHDPTEVG